MFWPSPNHSVVKPAHQEGANAQAHASAPRVRPCTLSRANRLARVAWSLVWLLLFRPSPIPAHAWRNWLLRMFGARLGAGVHVYPSVKVWAPWNLEMRDHSSLAPNVDCYCVDRVIIGEYSTVSQYSYLCTASHDYQDPAILKGPVMQLISGPIELGSRVWITAGVFVGPGVAVGDGTVVLARSVVVHDLPPWSIAAGQPATVRKPRVLRPAVEPDSVHSKEHS